MSDPAEQADMENFLKIVDQYAAEVKEQCFYTNMIILTCVTLPVFVKLTYSCWFQIPFGDPWNAPRAKEWDHLTMKDFLDQHVETE